MKTLVINAGSSSIKFRLLDMPSGVVLCDGLVERIGFEQGNFRYTAGETGHREKLAVPSHRSGFELISGMLLHPETGIVRTDSEIAIVGHRVVHGGDRFSTTTLVTKEVKLAIAQFIPMAPLHNPHNLEGIRIAEELFPAAAQVAVFDTAFHRTMPLKARKYAIPAHFYAQHGIQAYGFHGTSHKYVSERAISHLGRAGLRIISIHLGNGCSITAVRDGKSLDHSLGFAPANGLIMGTRSGDIDHSLIFYLVEELGYSMEEVKRLLINESGMLGLSGHSDMRDVQEQAAAGNGDCMLALEMNAYRIRKYIGAYAAAMNGLDAVVFTAGIGENSPLMRKLVCEDMDYLGIRIDPKKNFAAGNGLREIQAKASSSKVLVIPTDEELEIAMQAFRLISQ